METKSAIIAGTAIREVIWCCSMALIADLASNFGINTWQPPIISIARAEDIPPMWHKGEVCK